MSNSITTRSPEFIHYISKDFTHRWKNSKGTKRGIWTVLKGGQWRGQRCFVIGGGPSLRDFDFLRLQGKGRIIAVNKAFLEVPFADMMIAMDPDFYTWIHDNKLGTNQKRERIDSRSAFASFKGLKVWIDSDNHRYNNIYFVYRLKDEELSFNLTPHGGVYSGNNSGVGGLMMACALRCNPIYLLGFDLRHQGKTSHYHGGYPNRRQAENTVETFRGYFNRLAPKIKRAGFKVYNLSPVSALKCFPKKSIDEVFNEQIGEDETIASNAGIPETVSEGNSQAFEK